MKTSSNIYRFAMKPVSIVALIAVVFLTSCSSRLSTKRYYDDDIYFSSKDLRNYTPPVNTPADTGSYAPYNGNNSNSSAAATPNYQNGQQVIDDYYDYQYASRIRRFYYPSNGWNYYDPWYTNSYWYNYNPYSFGTSVYVTYNFWPNSYNYWGYGNPWGGYNPWGNNPMWGYNSYGNGYGYGNGWGYGNGYGSPWMPYNPYACGWGYGNPYWGGGWGYNNGYYSGYNNGYYNGYYNGLYDGMAYNNYYFNGNDNNSYSYYGPYKQASTSGNKLGSFTENMQTALANDGQVLKYTPAIGSGKPTISSAAGKPMGIGAGTQGVKPNAMTTAPGVSGISYDNTVPSVGEKNLGDNTKPAVVKPNNSNFDSYKPTQTQPVDAKPSITGKPIQVFDYNETAPGNKGNVGTVNPNGVKQQQNNVPTQKPNFDNKPANSEPTYQKPNFDSKPANNEPTYQKPQNIDRPKDSDYPSNPPVFQDKPRNNDNTPKNNDWNKPQPDNNNYNNRPKVNENKPSYNPGSNRNDKPQYSAPKSNNSDWNSSPRNNNNGGGNYNSAPRNDSPRNMGGGGGGGNSPKSGGGNGRNPR